MYFDLSSLSIYNNVQFHNTIELRVGYSFKEKSLPESDRPLIRTQKANDGISTVYIPSAPIRITLLVFGLADQTDRAKSVYRFPQGSVTVHSVVVTLISFAQYVPS